MAEDDDLRTVIREFRTSVSAQLDDHGRRISSLEDRMTGVEDRLTGVEDRLTGVEDRLTGVEDRLGGLDGRVGELTEELRTRTRTMETAILNAIRDFARDTDRRLTRLEV